MQGIEDDEILLGCKSPEDDSNIDLRPVTQLGFQSRFSTDNEIGEPGGAKIAFSYRDGKRVKTSENKQRPRICNRVTNKFVARKT